MSPAQKLCEQGAENMLGYLFNFMLRRQARLTVPTYQKPKSSCGPSGEWLDLGTIMLLQSKLASVLLA